MRQYTRSVWTLSLGETLSWDRLTIAGKTPQFVAMALDPPGDRIIAYDGGGKHGWWSLSLGGVPTWTRLEATGSPPPPGSDRTVIFDPPRRRMLVFGGQKSFSRNVQGVWALSLDEAPTWTRPEIAGTQPIWSGQSAIYDPRRDRLIVYGGAVYGDRKVAQELWALSLSGPLRWSRLATASASPPPRGSRDAIYDVVFDRMVIFGGTPWEGNLGDVWALPLEGVDIDSPGRGR
jgi:hypothetical protein